MEQNTVQEPAKNSSNINSAKKELVQAYIGKNSEKMITFLKAYSPNIDGLPANPDSAKKMFSGPFWLAALFGPFYFVYRKMYLNAFIFTLALLIPITLLDTIVKIPNSINVIINIFFWGSIFPFLYARKVNKTIKQTKVDDKIKLLEMLKAKGGTNWVAVILSFVILGLSIFGITLIYTIFIEGLKDII